MERTMEKTWTNDPELELGDEQQRTYEDVLQVEPIKNKTTLTSAEKVRAAAAKIMYGTTDAEIALILGVSNHGRVNEAIKEVLAPLGLTAPGYKAR
jgi:hypothetical protein